MVATNAIKNKTGNVSIGTSIFAMAVLAQPLKVLRNTMITNMAQATEPEQMQKGGFQMQSDFGRRHNA